MNYEDKLLHLYTEQMMGIASVTPVGVVRGTDQLLQNKNTNGKAGIPQSEILAQGEQRQENDEELRELEIAKSFLKELKALDKVARGAQCGSLIGRIDYRIGKLKDLAKELITMHAQYETEKPA